MHQHLRMLRAHTLVHIVAAVLLAALLGACQQGRSTVLLEGEAPAMESRTYAWVQERIEAPEGSARVYEQEVEAELQRLIDEAFAARGFAVADEEDAGFLVTMRLDVTLDTRRYDPFFAVYSLQQFERGHLTLAALAPVSYQPFWIARGNAVLRETKRAMTRETVQWIEVDEEREWDVARLANAVMETFPRVDG